MTVSQLHFPLQASVSIGTHSTMTYLGTLKLSTQKTTTPFDAQSATARLKTIFMTNISQKERMIFKGGNTF